MKYLIILIIVFIVSTIGVQADNSDSCENIDKTAENIMTSRQSGVPMVEVVKLVNENIKSDTLNKFVTEMVKDAYKEPRFSTQDYKKKAILDFRNKWYLFCLELFEES
jgi:hypothetical protein